MCQLSAMKACNKQKGQKNRSWIDHQRHPHEKGQVPACHTTETGIIRRAGYWLVHLSTSKRAKYQMKQLGRLYMEEQNRHNNGDIAWKKKWWRANNLISDSAHMWIGSLIVVCVTLQNTTMFIIGCMSVYASKLERARVEKWLQNGNVPWRIVVSLGSILGSCEKKSVCNFDLLLS